MLSLDNKGIVMLREYLLEATRVAAESEAHKLAGRLSKGEKKNRKRMATVAAVYDLTPQGSEPCLALRQPAHIFESRRETDAPGARRWGVVLKEPHPIDFSVVDGIKPGRK